MDEKITIIEGPPPTFEAVSEGWVLSLNESPSLGNVAVTRLRTYNGPDLLERCHRAWRNRQTIHLEFRTSDGLEARAPIVAARHVETLDGQLLLLWVHLAQDAELELGYEDDSENDADQGDDEHPEDGDSTGDGTDSLGPTWSQ
jgi:hypothetical protein